MSKPITTIKECMEAMTSREATEKAIKELVAYHKNAALKEASEKALVLQKCNQYHSGETMWEDKCDEIYITVRNDNSYDEHHVMIVDKQSILNAYSDERIQ